MTSSSQPRRQRFFRFNAPMHIKQHFLHAHLDKSLKKRLNLKMSAIQVSKGDTVKVMSGKNKGKTGKIVSADLRTGRVSIDSLSKKNARGKEYNVSIHASNVYITDLNLSDKFRAERLKVARTVVKEEKKEAPKKSEEKKDAGASTRAEQAAMMDAIQNK